MQLITPQIKEKLWGLEYEYRRLIQIVQHGNVGTDPAGRVKWVSEKRRKQALRKSWEVAKKIRRLVGRAS